MNLTFCSMDCGFFFNAFYFSVKLLILFSCVVFLISLNCLSVFSHSYLSFPQRAIFNSLSGKLKISTSLESVTGKLFCSFGGIIFPWFFMYLEDLGCSLLIWSCLLHLYWLTLGEKWLPSALLQIPRLSQTLCGYTYFTLLTHSSGRILKFVCLLSILHCTRLGTDSLSFAFPSVVSPRPTDLDWLSACVPWPSVKAHSCCHRECGSVGE